MILLANLERQITHFDLGPRRFRVQWGYYVNSENGKCSDVIFSGRERRRVLSPCFLLVFSVGEQGHHLR